MKLPLFYPLAFLLPSITLLAMNMSDTSSQESLNNKLIELVKSNNTSDIFDFLKKGASANRFDGGSTLLHIAAQNPKDDPCMTFILLAHQVPIDTLDKNYDTALHIAARNLNQAIVFNLIANKTDTTIKNKHGELASDLVHRMLIIKNFNTAVSDYQNACSEKTRNKQIIMIRSLIELSKNITTVDKTSLPFADSLLLIDLSAWKEKSTLPLIELLLDNGAKLDVISAKHNSPLHIAATCAIPETFELILKYTKNDTQINLRNNDGNTPVHVAVYSQQKNVLKQLLKRGAQINLTNNQKNTPLHLALAEYLLAPSECKVKIINHILDKQPILSIKNEDGKTPLNLIEKPLSIKEIGIFQTFANKASNYCHKDLIDRLKKMEDKQITSKNQTE